MFVFPAGVSEALAGPRGTAAFWVFPERQRRGVRGRYRGDGGCSRGAESVPEGRRVFLMDGGHSPGCS